MKRFKASLLLAVLLAQQATIFAALTEFYVQTTGDNLNAGSDLNDAAELTSSNGNWNSGTGVFICNGATDLSGVAVGEWASIYTDGATVGVFVAKITNVNDGTDTITVSTTVKSGTAPSTSATARTIKVGGAWKGPNSAEDFPFGFIQNTAIDNAGEKPLVYVKSGTYTITDNITHANAGILWEGYGTTPGDGWTSSITYPRFDGVGTVTDVPFIMLTQDGDGNVMRFFHFDGNYSGTPLGTDGSGNAMVDSTANNALYDRCLFTGAHRFGFRVDASGTTVIECEFTGNNTADSSDFGGAGAIGPSTWIRCMSYRNDIAGAGGDNLGFNFNPGTGEIITAIECIAEGNSKHGFQLQGSNGSGVFIRCVSYNNLEDGFYSNGTGSSLWVIENSISYGNTGYGFRRNTAADGAMLFRKNAAGDNTAGLSSNLDSAFIKDGIVLSADPFTDPANGDFSLNDTAGGGALLKNTGRGAFPNQGGEFSDTNVSYPNVGAIQHDDVGGSGGGTVAYPIIK